MTNTNKTPALVGAGIGLATFLAVALLPALLYGGYAGVLLAGGIFGTPVAATFAVRALIVFGMVLGVTAVGSLFAVAGAAAGAAVGVLLRATPSAKKASAANEGLSAARQARLPSESASASGWSRWARVGPRRSSPVAALTLPVSRPGRAPGRGFARCRGGAAGRRSHGIADWATQPVLR